MKCIVCEREFKPTESGWFDGGDYDTFMPQYGSNHDMTSFKIFICDVCIDAKLSSGVIEVINNDCW